MLKKQASFFIHLILFTFLPLSSQAVFAFTPKDITNYWGESAPEDLEKYGVVVGNIRFFEGSKGADAKPGEYVMKALDEWDLKGILKKMGQTFGIGPHFTVDRADGYFLWLLPPGDYKFHKLELTTFLDPTESRKNSGGGGLVGILTTGGTTTALGLPKPERILRVRPARIFYMGHIHYDISLKEDYLRSFLNAAMSGSIGARFEQADFVTTRKDKSNAVKEKLESWGYTKNKRFIRHMDEKPISRI